MKRGVCKLFLAVPVFLLLASVAWAQQPKSAGSKTLDPCTLVSKAEIMEIVGMKVSDGKPNSANVSAGPICEFTVGDYGALSFYARQNNPNDAPDKIMGELKKRNIQATELKGVGDRSFYAEQGYGMIQLNTFKGSTYIIITLLVPGAPAEKAAGIAEKLMQKVLAKL